MFVPALLLVPARIHEALFLDVAATLLQDRLLELVPLLVLALLREALAIDIAMKPLQDLLHELALMLILALFFESPRPRHRRRTPA